MKKNSNEEERLRNENEKMKRELIARGGVFKMSEDIPPQLQHQFLKSIFEVENRMQKELEEDQQRWKGSAN